MAEKIPVQVGSGFDADDITPAVASSALRLTGCRLVEVLGRGAGSVVYRAERDGRGYAVKMMTGPSTGGGETAFAREAALLASLRHPGLLDIYEVGRIDGRPYLIMELVEGRPLSQVIRDGPMDGAGVAGLGAQLAQVLAVAHDAGLVHRDVKPDNILIEPDGRVRLIDFGLAAAAGGGIEDEAVGTFLYSAPEQTGMLHRPVDGRADLYALGVVLFECLAGEPPFQARDAGELMRLHLSAPVPDLCGLGCDADPALAAVVRRLMAKDPDDRYAAAEAVYRDLAPLAGGDRDTGPDGAGHHPPGGRPTAPGGRPTAPGGRSTSPGGRRNAPGGRRTAMVGRAKELARLRSCWDRATSGRGSAVLVTGAGGIGTSRLVDEVVRHVAAGGNPVLSGASGAEHPAPLAPLIAAVEHHLAEVAALAEPERSRAVAMLTAVAGSAAALLTPLAPTLPDLIGAPVDPASTQNGSGAGTSGRVDEDRFAEAVTGFLVGLAEASGGAVLLLEDAQRWDETTRAVIHRLATALSESRLLVLVTARDEDAGDIAEITATLDPALGVRIRLEPLSQPEVGSLVTAALGGGIVPQPLIDRLASRGGGNPLAVLEYLRAAMHGGVLLPHWGAWRLDETGFDDLRLPSDIFDLMLRRVDAVGPAAHDLLVVAAAIGSQFTPELVGEALARWLPQPSDGAETVLDVPRALATALANHLVEPADGRYAFAHEAIRRALLDRLEPARRRALHQHIAEAMQARHPTDSAAIYAIAHHYLNGDTDREPERLFHATAAAGQRALAEYASAQAYAFFQRAAQAADVAGIDPDARFHGSFGLAANLVGEHEVAQDQVRRALAKEPDAIGRAVLYSRLADSHTVQWEGRQAMRMAELGLAEIGRSLPRHPLPLVLTAVGRALGARLLHLLPARWGLATGDRRDRDQAEARLLAVIGQGAAYAMQMPLVMVTSMRCSFVAARLGPGRERVDDLLNKALSAGMTGRDKRSQRLFAQALGEAEALGDPTVIAKVHFAVALSVDGGKPLEVGTGELTRAVLTGHGQWLPASDYLLLASTLGLLELMRGDLAQATVWYERATRRVAANGTFGNPAMALGASIEALAGRPVEAAARLREVQAFAASDPTNIGTRANTALTAAHIAVEQGESGAPFDDAIAEFRALNLRPGRVFIIQRTFWVFQALGRLAHVDSATGEDRAVRIAAARTAVRELRRVAIGSLYRAYATVAEAWLDQIRGEPASALRRLATLDAAAEGHNSVLVDYEIARVRARALTSLDRPAEALRHARLALALATEHGWQTRARWVRAEFDLALTTGTAHHSGVRESGLALSVDSDSQMRRLQAVHQVSLAAAAVLEPRELCRVALDETVKILAAERAFLFLADDESDRLVPYIGRDATGGDLHTLTGYGASLVQRVRDTAEALVVTGSEQGAAMGSHSAVIHGLRSIIVAPVQLKDALIGVFYLDSRAARGIFTTDDVQILAAISHHVAVSFETARAARLELDIKTAQRERDLAEMLRLAMVELSDTLDPDSVIRRMTELIGQVMTVDAWSILRYADDGRAVTASGTAGDGSPVDGSDPMVGRLLSLDDPLRCQVGDSGPLADGRAGTGVVGCHLGDAIRAWMALPLLVRGQRRGVLLLGRVQPLGYTDGEARIAATLASQGMTAYDNAQLFRQVDELASQDGLTGLFIRRHFFAVADPGMAAARQHPHPVAAVMVDIDLFKSINDAHGHAVGDEVIREVARRLSGCVRSSDVICRYGGEEFAVLLTEASAEQAATVAGRLHSAIRNEPIATEAGLLRVTVSVGVTEPTCEHVDLQSLLNDADQALYSAKRAGRDRVVAAASASTAVVGKA